MNSGTSLKGPFIIDGTLYKTEELALYCNKVINDGSEPGWKRDIMAFIGLFIDPDGGNIIQYTSGTTGDPKQIYLNRQSMINSAVKTIKYFNLKSAERLLLCLPIRYIAGKMMVVRALVGGLDLVCREPSGRPLKDLLPSDVFSFGAMVPLQVHESIQNKDNLALIETLLVGGGEIHNSLKNRLLRMEKPSVYESFASTETYTHFALKRINGREADSEFLPLEGVSVSLDERGCLVVDVPGITEGHITTNDLVEISENSQGFRWLGRFDNLINSGGIKIIPEELERTIRELLDRDCLVLSVKDPRLGEKVVLMVETADQDPPLDSWMQELRKNLTPYEIPSRIIPVEIIPRNFSLKPDRLEALKLI